MFLVCMRTNSTCALHLQTTPRCVCYFFNQIMVNAWFSQTFSRLPSVQPSPEPLFPSMQPASQTRRTRPPATPSTCESACWWKHLHVLKPRELDRSYYWVFKNCAFWRPLSTNDPNKTPLLKPLVSVFVDVWCSLSMCTLFPLGHAW